MKIAIITTRQNYAWTSMQEVLPALEKCWQNAADETLIINVDCEPIRKYIQFLLGCDAFIIIAYNETISRFITALRKDLQINCPIIFHLYGHATIAMWPEARFGALELFKTNDVFIGTCPGDLKCLELSLPNARGLDIPYPYEEMNSLNPIPKKKTVFAYVGRLSDQKNVDLLLKAYSLLPSDSPQLFIYGKEDHLGSPNMGIDSTQCLNHLLEISQNLGIQDRVIFKGFQTREHIYEELGTDHIFVSASTHSDENFGMAAMRSLALGGKAVLSSWGGHTHFKNKFADKVFLSPVHFENDRPVVDSADFSEKMKEALGPENFNGPYTPSYFLPATVTAQFKQILSQLNDTAEAVAVSDVARKIHLQQLDYEKQGYRQRAFHSYSDPLAQLYLRSYQC